MKRLTSKLIYQLTLVTVLVSAAAMMLGHQGASLKVITWAYYLLILGVLIYLWELKKRN